VFFQSSEVIGNPRVMSVIVVPVVPGCPAPSDNTVFAQLGGIGNPLLQRQRSGQVLLLELPKLSQGSGGQIVFSESAGGAFTPQPVTLEVSIGKCSGVIDTDIGNMCNLRSTNGNFNALQWLFKPFGAAVDAATANQRGFCWAADPVNYYVNARWTYEACAQNVEACGFAIQYNVGTP
jgi:hypothetical protein